MGQYNSTEEMRMKIFRYIKQYIRKNRLQQGDRLPSENTLAQQFGVNRNTVRSALAQLRSQGLIYSEKGRGFFVAAKQTPILFEHDNGMGFSEILNQGNRNYHSRILNCSLIPAGTAESRIFGISPGDNLYFLKVLRIIDEEPFAICHSILPEYLLPNFDKHLEGFFSVNHIIIHDYGYEHPQCENVCLEACSPTLEDMKYLNIPVHMPILKQMSTFCIPDTGVIEYFIVRARSDRFRFSMSFKDSKE